MPIKLVVFDIAGTTVEDLDGVGRCLKAALTAAEVSWASHDVNAVMGIPKPLAIRQLMDKVGVPPDALLVSAIHRDFQVRMIEHYRTSPEIKEVPGAAEAFREIRARGIKVALDAGFDRTIVDALLARLEWDSDLIDASITSDEVDCGRPHPDLIFALMKQLGVEDPADVMKVGDTPSDLLEGTAAGCGMVVGVTSGTHSAALLSPHPHTHLVESVRDVPALIS